MATIVIGLESGARHIIGSFQGIEYDTIHHSSQLRAFYFLNPS
jgi:hypothetical protein